tara:strand:- start:683 stop:793 length:111 start_codon:yes stop_codon:yes gene_type:complete
MRKFWIKKLNLFNNIIDKLLEVSFQKTEDKLMRKNK